MLNRKISHIDSYSIILNFYFYLCVLYYFIPAQYTLYYANVLVFCSFIFCLRTTITRKKILYFIFIIVSFLLIQIINNRFSYAIFYIIMNLFMLQFLVSKKFNITILNRGFIFLILFILLCFGVTNSFDNILVGTSRNFISVFFVSYACLIYGICYAQKQKMPIIIALLTFFISVLAQGRTGMICSFILVLGYFIVKYDLLKSFKSVLFLIFLFFLLYTVIVYFINNLEIFSRIKKEGFESNAREAMLLVYLDNMNVSTILKGYNYHTEPLFVEYGGNPHNSYIRLHYLTGIGFFCYVFLLIYSLFAGFKRNVMLFFMILSISLRALTDIAYYFDKFDFVIFYLIYLSILKCRKITL